MQLIVDIVAKDGDNVELGGIALYCRNLGASKAEAIRLFEVELDKLIAEMASAGVSAGDSQP